MATTITYDIKVNTKSINDLESELADVNSQLKEMAIGSEEFNQATIKAQKLTSQLEGVQSAVKGISFEQKLQGFQGAIELVGGSVAATVGSLALFGIESERIGEIETAVQGAISTAMGLREAAEGAAKVAILARQVATNLGIASTVAATEAEVANTAATNANTAAVNANKAAWLTNPYVLAAAAIVALGVAIYQLTKNTDDNTESLNRQIAANQALQQQLSFNASVVAITGTAYQRYNANLKEAKAEVEGLILELEKQTKGTEKYQEVLEKLNKARDAERLLTLTEEQRLKNLNQTIEDKLTLSERDLKVKEATVELDNEIADAQERLKEANLLPSEAEELNENLRNLEQYRLKVIAGIDKEIANTAKQRRDARAAELQNLRDSLKKLKLENDRFFLEDFEARKQAIDDEEGLEIERLTRLRDKYKVGSAEYKLYQELLTETAEKYSNQRVELAQEEAEAVVELYDQLANLQLEFANNLGDIELTWTTEFISGTDDIIEKFGELITQAEKLNQPIQPFIDARQAVLVDFSVQKIKEFRKESESLIQESQIFTAELILQTQLYSARNQFERTSIENTLRLADDFKTIDENAKKTASALDIITERVKAIQKAKDFLARREAGKLTDEELNYSKAQLTAIEALGAVTEQELQKLIDSGLQLGALFDRNNASGKNFFDNAQDAAENYNVVLDQVNEKLQNFGLRGQEGTAGRGMLAGIAYATQAEKDAIISAVQEIIDTYLQLSEQLQSIFTSISGFGIANTEERIARLEEEYDAAKGNAALQKQLAAQILAEGEALERKKRAQAIINVGIDAAQAGMAAYASSLALPQPAAGIVLAATLAAIGIQAGLSIKAIKSASETDGDYSSNIASLTGAGGGGGMGPAYATAAPDVYTEAPIFQTYVLSGDVTSALYADARLRARRVL